MSEPVEGRSCDGCHMCCKVFPVAAVPKAQGVWCPHCKIGVGCAIYEMRPEPCREFLCGYRVDASLSEAWKPSNAKFVLFADPDSGRITVQADAVTTDTWRREPYYGQLKQWAKALAASNRSVTVFAGKRAIALLPDRDVDLGEVKPDEVVVTHWVNTPGGRRREALKLHKDDPRLK